MKCKLSTMLALTLLSLTACGSAPSGIKNWCLEDKWMCASRHDTEETIRQVTEHNVGYAVACPKQPQTCH